MLNGIANAAACCAYTPESGSTPGYGTTPDTKPVTVGGVQVNVPRSPGGLLSQIGAALDQAVHGGDSATAQGLVESAARTYSGGANVVPFPMVNPYKPVVAAGIPVSGMTAWPKRFPYKVADTGGGEPDDEQSSFDGLSGGATGLSLGDGNTGLGAAIDEIGLPPPVPVYRSSGSTLQTILGTIQATLPATIQAIRAQPSNIFPGTTYGPYATNAGGTYPGSQAIPPEGYYYDQSGSLRKVGSAVGGAVGSVGQSLMDFVRTNPLLVLGGGVALVLLFMNPPKRR